MRLVALTDNPNVDFESVVGQKARFVMNHGHGLSTQRVWTGVCNELEQLAAEDTGLSSYHIAIVPTFWLATQRRNHRMFQQLSEPDVVVKMLAEWGIEPLLKIDKAAYKKRKYRVQYAESDYAFICRHARRRGHLVLLRIPRRRIQTRTCRCTAIESGEDTHSVPRQSHDGRSGTRDECAHCAKSSSWKTHDPRRRLPQTSVVQPCGVGIGWGERCRRQTRTISLRTWSIFVRRRKR